MNTHIVQEPARTKEEQMLARQQKAEELDVARDNRAAPAPVSFVPKPQANPDWAALQAEVIAQYPQTLAYLAK
jgi:hypothetical protein